MTYNMETIKMSDTVTLYKRSEFDENANRNIHFAIIVQRNNTKPLIEIMTQIATHDHNEFITWIDKWYENIKVINQYGK